jgi:RHS repeat-associated protein
MKKVILIFFLITLFTGIATAQIIGSTQVTVGQSLTYEWEDDQVYSSFTWHTNLGTVTLPHRILDNYYATVQWTAPGTATLTFATGGVTLGTLYVTITCATPPGAPTGSSGQTCGSGTVGLSGTPGSNANTLRWYSASTGGTLLATATTYTTPTISATTTYYITSYNSTSGCESTSRVAVTATVNQIPGPVTVYNLATCTGTSASITGIISNGTIRWYNTLSGGTLLGTGLTFTTPVLTATTPYYYSAYNSTTGCESSRYSTPVTVTVNPSPPAPTSVEAATLCGPGSAYFLANGASSCKWYSATGTLLYSGPNVYTPSISTTTTFYVTNVVNGCESSPKTQVVGTVYPIPGAPTAINGQRCGSGAVTLGGTPATNANSIRWYSAATGGTLLSTGTSYTTPSISSTTTYYITSFNTAGSTCESTVARVPVTAIVNQIPGPVTVYNTSACINTIATITGINNAGTIRWYDALSGGNLLGTGLTFNTPVLTTSVPHYYYYSGYNSTTGCESSVYSTPVMVTVFPLPPPPTSVEQNTLCGPGTAYLYANGTNVANWYSATGTLLSAGPELYEPYVSATTTFYVTSVVNGCESSPRTQIIEPVLVPVASATNQNIFSSQATSINIGNPNNIPGISFAWTVSSQSSNISGAQGGSGNSIVQTLTNSTSANGSVTYSITPSGSGCTGLAASVTVTVFPLPAIGGPSFIAKVPSVTLDAGAGYDSYVWNNNPSLNTETFIATTAGTYTVTVTKGGASIPVYFTLGSQLSNENINYISTNSPMFPNLTDPTTFVNLPIDQVNQSTTYFDGLGRSVQSVVTQGSPAKNDIVTPQSYDVFGRANRHFLPVVVENNGRYKTGILDNSYNYTGEVASFYNNGSADKIADDTRPFSETVFEPSPLNRPAREYGPGSDWNNTTVDQPIKYCYPVNITGTGASQEQIIAWTLDSLSGMPVRSGSSNTNVSGGYYTTGQLVIKSTKDENGNETREYTDNLGHLILKKSYVTGTLTDFTTVGNWAETYYLYDNNNNLRFVFQPELSKIAQGSSTYNPTTADLASFAFQYQYDSRNRMIVKQVPGTAPVYTVYDSRDRVVLTQDGNLRKDAAGNDLKKWLFTKYDAFNRPVVTGIYVHSTVVNQPTMTSLISTSNLFESYNGDTNNYGYTNSVFSSANFNQSGFTVLTVNYYDQYNFKSLIGPTSASYNYYNDGLTQTVSTFTYSQPVSEFKNTAGTVVGKSTGGIVFILGTSTPLWSVTYYDSKYRTIQVVSTNAKGGFERQSTLFDFTGKPLKTLLTQQTSTHPTNTITERFVYDHVGRVGQIFHRVQVNLSSTQEVMLVQNQYNEVGQLVDKALYSTDNGMTRKQSIDYRYNIRGWLLSMNNSQLLANAANNDDIDDLFGMELGYTNSIGTGNTPWYNGNIGGMKWSLNQASGPIRDVAYNYTYDPLNRLTNAYYLNDNAGAWSNTLNAYTETGYHYDLNGNILGLLRHDNLGNTMDNLGYTYSSGTGNQLQKVSDSGDKTTGFIDGSNSGNDYAYDLNGNMVTDQNKGLTASNAIQYNQLNLPSTVTKSTGEKIVFSYDATGRKLSEQVYNASGVVQKTTEYDGNFVYQNDVLQFINHEEGRVVMTGASPEYQYHMKDHLGNVRVTFTTAAQPQTFTAGFETANESAESSNFLDYHTSQINTMTPTNPNAHTGNGAYELNGGYAGQVGIAKSFSVIPGDVVAIQAFAKYSSPSATATNFAPFIGALLGAFNLSAPAVGETGTAAAGINNFGAIELGATGDESKSDPMKVFVTIIMFDLNYNYLDVAYQAVQADGSLNTSYKASKPGYAYVYISNEHPYVTDVFFDDVTITFTPTPVVQLQDYYPFGLKFNSYTRVNALSNTTVLFQSQEHLDDLGLDWDSFKWRNHQPEIGRFFNIDPLANKYVYNSPYAFSENKVVAHIELEGLEAEAIISLAAKYGVIFGMMSSTSSQGAINRLMTNSSSLAPSDATRGNSSELSNKTLGTINDAKTVTDATSKNTKTLGNEVSKDGLAVVKAIGTGIEIGGLGTPVSAIGGGINFVAGALDETRQVALEGKPAEDAAVSVGVDAVVGLTTNGLGNAAKSTVKEGVKGKEAFDTAVDAHTFSYSSLTLWVVDLIQSNTKKKN